MFNQINNGANTLREFSANGEVDRLENNSATNREILSRKEVANLFGVSYVCIHDWVKRGLLKPYKMGNRTYFNRVEVYEKLYSSNRG